MDTIQFNIRPRAEEVPAPPYTWRWRKIHNGKPFWYYSHELNISGETDRVEYRETANDVWREVQVKTVTDEKPFRAVDLSDAPIGKSIEVTYKAIGGVVKDTWGKIKLHRKNRGIGRTRKASSKRKKK